MSRPNTGNQVVKSCSRKFDSRVRFTTLVNAFEHVWVRARAIVHLSRKVLKPVLDRAKQCAKCMRYFTDNNKGELSSRTML